MQEFSFGTVVIYRQGSLIEASFPKDRGLSDLFKSYRFRWNPARKCWSGTINDNDFDKWILEVENSIWSKSPRGWKEASSIFAKIPCVTKAFSIHVGAGGLRLNFPPGHPNHHYIQRLGEIGRDGSGTWLVPARYCLEEDLKRVIIRMHDDDKRIVSDVFTVLEGRRIKGRHKVTWDGSTRLIHANESFLKKADPDAFEGSIRYWPFKIIKSSQVVGSSLSDLLIEYPSFKEAYVSMRDIVSMDMSAGRHSFVCNLTSDGLVGAWKIA